MKNNHRHHLSAEHLQIGERIKLRMKYVNCSRQEIARYCNVTERTVYNWCESRSIPELKVIPSLCFILQSHIPWFITGSIDQYQWVDYFPDGFLSFLSVIRRVPIENRGYILRSVFDMVVSLDGHINRAKKSDKQCLVNKEMVKATEKKPIYCLTHKHEIQENMTFSERFQQQKIQLNLSNKDISIACDVSQKTVYNWSLGNSFPSIDLLPLLCDTLDADISWLITGTCNVPQWLNMSHLELEMILYQLNKLPVRITSQIFRLASSMVKEIEGRCS